MSSAKAQQSPMMQTHQSHKAAQFGLVEVVEFSIKSISLTTMGILPLVASVFTQRKSIVM